MPIVANIRTLDFSQLIKLSGIFISRPLFVLPTLKATAQTIKVCNQLFGSDHHKNNPENAFRHALWNYLICEKCMKYSKSQDKVISWAKKFTDLHEHFSPNLELEMAMDLHNNEIGRILFQNRDKTLNFIQELKELLSSAVRVEKLQEIQTAGFHLVCLDK